MWFDEDVPRMSYEEGEKAQEAVFAMLGLPKNPGNRFRKMVLGLFPEDNPPIFSVKPAMGSDAVVSQLSIGDNVVLRARGKKDASGSADEYVALVKVITREGQLLGDLEAEKEQRLLLAMNMANCIAFVHSVNPLQVRLDLITDQMARTNGEVKGAAQNPFSSPESDSLGSSTRYKSVKTYCKKRPERAEALGVEVGPTKKGTSSSTENVTSEDENRIRMLVVQIRQSYEGKVRPGSVKQLERECAEYKSAKKEFVRYTEAKGVKLVDFLKEQEIVSAVLSDDSKLRPAQSEIDAWYEKAGLVAADDPDVLYPDLTVLSFVADIDSRYVEEGSVGKEAYELFRAGDVLKYSCAPRKLGDPQFDEDRYDIANNLRFDFLGEDNPIVVMPYWFSLRAAKRARYFDYTGDDLLLLISQPKAFGVEDRCIQSRVLGTSGGRQRSLVSIETKVALDEKRYRASRLSVNPSLGAGADVEVVDVTVDESGKGDATFRRVQGRVPSGMKLSDFVKSRDIVSKYAGAFDSYKSLVRTTVLDGGVEVSVEYRPSRALTQLDKYLQQSRRVEPCENSQVGNSLSPAESVKIMVDMMRVIALLTDEEMLERVVRKAPRKKDGDLAAARLAVSVDMDGVFADGTYYNVSAKSDSSNGLNISVKKKRLWQDKLCGGAAQFLEENADIVRRMGL